MNVQKTPTKGGMKADGGIWPNATPQADATNALAQLGAVSLAANPVSNIEF